MRYARNMHDGTRISCRLLSLPRYLMDHANRLTDEYRGSMFRDVSWDSLTIVHIEVH